MKISINLHLEYYWISRSSFNRIKHLVLVIALMVSFPIKSYSKNYYVKSAGNDNNTGLSDAQAWATIAKVNASSFLPGDTIFFNKGDTWRETLIIPSSGSAGQPIIFSFYGTGNKPIIQPTTQVTSWTQVGATDVWYGTLTTSPAEVFIGDVYCQPAHWPAAVGASTPTFQYPSANSADATHLTDSDLSGRTEAELVGAQVNIYTTGFTQKNVAISAFNDATDILSMATVTISPDTTMKYYLTAPAGTGITFSNKSWMITENTWFYDTDAQRLYVWKTGGGNPGTVEASTGTQAIYSSNKSYITIDGIHVRYSAVEGIFCTNWNLSISGITIQNCTSNYNHSVGIEVGRTLNGNESTLTNISINSNSLDHNGNIGILTANAFGTSIVDNTITYTGGLYPQLPGGGQISLSAGIYLIGDADEFLMDRNIISYTSQDGIFYSGSPHGTISINTISNTCIYLEDSGGIYSTEANSKVIITSNILTNTGDGIYFDEVSDGGTVEHNIVNGGAVGMVWHRAFNIIARYNKFVGPFTSGYIFAINSSGTKVTGSTFAYNIIDGVDKKSVGINIGGNSALESSLIDIQNNVIVNCSTGISILQDLPSVINDIKNNIFYNNITHILTASGNVVSIDYNLFYGTGNWIWGGLSKATFALWKTASSGDVNSINADPLFVSSSDFHLRPSSPCINAGIDVGLTTDYDGNASKDPPSIGAYEYGSQPASPVIPVYQSSVVENATPSLIEMTYNLSLAIIVPEASTFLINVNSVARVVNSVAISGTKVLLTLASPVVYGDVITVAYTKPSSNPLQTSSGGQAATLTSQAVTNNLSPPVPVYLSSVIQNSTPSKLEMTYSLSLGNSIPASTAFIVNVNSVTRAVSAVAVSGTIVSLTLSSSVVYGDAVDVAYTKPSSNPLQTAAGGQATSFNAQKVTNNVASVSIPVYVSSSVVNATPSKINVLYSLGLANIVPPVSAFTVTVNSSARTVNSVAISGTTVILTIASAVAYGDAVKLAYTKPSSNPLQTSAGGQASSFSAQKVSNNVQLNNTAPVVMVNYQSTTYAGFVNELDASGSYDTNNDKLTYSWVIPGNIPVSSTTGSTIQYLSPIVDASQKVQFVLNVSDGKTTQSKTIPVEIAPYEPGLDIAEVVKVEASDYLSPNYPSNIIDGNIGTMWAVNGDNQWLLLELKEPFSVQHVDLAFQPGQKKESYFDILGSEDNVTWESILTKSNSCAFSGDLQVFDFPPSKTDKEFRYIKLIGHCNSVDTWNYISEFRIFGYRHKNPTSYEEQPVKIYPNPANEFINIRIDEPTLLPDFIRIISLSGKIVFQDKINPDIKELQIPLNLIEGVYIVQIESDDLTVFTQKLIVDK